MKKHSLPGVNPGPSFEPAVSLSRNASSDGRGTGVFLFTPGEADAATGKLMSSLLITWNSLPEPNSLNV